ncbi:MAG: tetratricopeptide repeat protein [Burkholderiaceae bacterium]|nr:tetratricopeptide repeat protein [Burkholderiaceae bacterium]MCX8005123.1 tetratricopeptide repeat protein [Burkholderiaceae bacterium]
MSQNRKTSRLRGHRWTLALPALLLAAGCALSPARPGEADAPGASLHERATALEEAERLYEAGRWADAQAAFEALLQTHPRNAYLWMRLGNALARQGLYENAAAALQNAVVLDGSLGRAAFNLGLVRLAQAEAAFDYARTRLASLPQARAQAETLHSRVQRLLAELDRGGARQP